MYQLTTSGIIKRLTDNAFIPADPANTDFIEYQAWLAAGNTPEPEPAPVPEPQPDWDGLYSSLLTSSVFAHINVAARTDPNLAVAYADAGFALTRASLGLVNVDAIQVALGNVLGLMTGDNALSPAEQDELVDLITQHHLDNTLVLEF